MKKKLLVFLTSILLLASMMGCSANGQAFLDESKKMNGWEAYSQTGKGSITMDIQGEKANIDFTMNSTYNTKDLTGISTVHFTSSDPKVKLPDMEMYLDKGVAYINKGYFTGVFTLNGQEIPAKLADLKADYIGFDLSADLGNDPGMAEMNQFIQKMADPAMQEKITSAMENTFKDIEIPVQKEDQTYTIKMDSDQLLDVGVQAVDALVKELPSLSKELGLNLPQKDMDEMLSAYEKAKKDLPAQMETAKQMLKGSKLDMAVTFGDNKVDQTLNMNVALGAMGSMSMKFAVISEKADPKSIPAPGTLKLLTMKEFAGIMTPEMPPVDVTPAPEALPEPSTSTMVSLKSGGALILKNEESFSTPGDVYVDAPIKVMSLHDVTYYEPTLLFEALDYTGNTSNADGVTIKGIQYLSAKGFQSLGFQVEDLGPTLFITK